MQFLPSYDLQKLNTLNIAAKAEYFCEVKSQEDVRTALSFAQEKNLPIKVLGGGSNVVMADFIPALVVQYVASGFEVLSETSEHVLLSVQAGQNWHELVIATLKSGYFGLENLSLIPGSAGAAPVQNIGAYGVEVKDFIQTVHGINLKTGEGFSLSNGQCQFAYRESIFKQALNDQTLITSVEFKLNKIDKPQLAYAPLNSMAQEYMDENGIEPSAEQVAKWVIDVRKAKLPDPVELPNAGSFFKNPVISEQKFNELKQKFETLPSYSQPEGVKVPAGWLIDNLGLKGQMFGSVKVHEKQALVLVNCGGNGEDVSRAAAQVKAKVEAAYGIELEQEPRLF